jgi:hypothetical protein
MAAIDNLQQAYNNITALLASITANPKPTYSVDGRSISWESYVAMLTKQLEVLNQQIQVQSGPIENVTQAIA